MEPAGRPGRQRRHLADTQAILLLPQILYLHPLHPLHRDPQHAVRQPVEIDDGDPGGDGQHVAQGVGLARVHHAEGKAGLPRLGDHPLVSRFEDPQRHDTAGQQVGR